ncbi:copia protein [Tanacetum coccineum]|uniref:Copia protein n=1 Tax=Tanacetum coccineum TaxID=301880 RepID=A0ABQ5FUT0_9ASTR
MFDEYLEPPRVERPVSPTLAVSVPVNSAGTPSSTTIDQDAPSPSHSSSSSALQSPSLHQGVAADSTLMEDNPFALVDNHPFLTSISVCYVHYLTLPQVSQKLQTAKDLQGDTLLHYDAEMELMNLILLSIPNDIYNSVDACTSAKDMWKRVERLMRGTIQNKVDRETRFINEFDQFVVEPGEALVSIYNRFAQLMKDLERNDMHFPIVKINTKFLNSLQLEWLKYVTQVRLAKRLTVDTFDDLFYYLQQFEKWFYWLKSKEDDGQTILMILLASRNVVTYACGITQNFSTLKNMFRNSSKYQNQQSFQRRQGEYSKQGEPSGNTGRNNTRAYVQEEIVEGSNAPNETGNVQRTLRTSSLGNTSTVQCYNCSGKGHYARNCPKPRVRDSKYFMEQMLLAKQDEAGVIL